MALSVHSAQDPALAAAWDRSDDHLLFEEEHLEHPGGGPGSQNLKPETARLHHHVQI